MTLRECYIEHSYYYPRLESEMNQIVGQKGLDSLKNEAIGAFCSGALGELRLDNAEDYRNILSEFQYFVSGIAWALKQCLTSNQRMQCLT